MDGFLSDWLQMLLEDNQNVTYHNQRNVQCPRCQMTWRDFQNSGRLGCAECYKTFSKELTSIVTQLHGSSEHRGKIPFAYNKEMAFQRKVTQLREELNQLVKEEKFEKAAEIRDAIRDLEEEGVKENEG